MYNPDNDFPDYEPTAIIHKRRADDSKLWRMDTSINIGNIVGIVGLIITILLSYNGIISRMITMENKVDLMWSKFEVGLKKN